MAIRSVNAAVHHLRRVALNPEIADLTDGALLEAFLRQRSEAAFAALVQRHGGMVLGVCRRMVGDAHDAEDAFQAAFLVLARKAASVVPRQAVGNWLYGVAYRIAQRMRAVKARRASREKLGRNMSQLSAAPAEPMQDWEKVLDEELSRLPDKYRLPLVLCDLENRPRKEVARQLKLLDGTLSSRLATARTRLAKRLTRRGVMLSAAALAVALAESAAAAGVSGALVASTSKAASLYAAGRAASGLVSEAVAAGAEEAIRAMFLARIKTLMAVLLTLFLLGTFGAGVAQLALAEPQPRPDEQVEPPRAFMPGGLKQIRIPLHNFAPTVEDDAGARPVTASFTVSVKPKGADKAIVQKVEFDEPFLYREGDRYTLPKQYKWGSVEIVANLKDNKLVVEKLSIDITRVWNDDIRLTVIDVTTDSMDGRFDRPKLKGVNLTVDGAPVQLFGGSRGAHLELLADVTYSGAITLRGPDKGSARPATRYEVIDALVPHGADRDKRLEAVLGKGAVKKLERWNDLLAGFEWDPKNVNAGDDVCVYFPSGMFTGELKPTASVNSKIIPLRKDFDEIRLPASLDDPKTPLLRIRVPINPGLVVPEGVGNILILRPIRPAAKALDHEGKTVNGLRLEVAAKYLPEREGWGAPKLETTFTFHNETDEMIVLDNYYSYARLALARIDPADSVDAFFVKEKPAALLPVKAEDLVRIPPGGKHGVRRWTWCSLLEIPYGASVGGKVVDDEDNGRIQVFRLKGPGKRTLAYLYRSDGYHPGPREAVERFLKPGEKLWSGRVYSSPVQLDFALDEKAPKDDTKEREAKAAAEVLQKAKMYVWYMRYLEGKDWVYIAGYYQPEGEDVYYRWKGVRIKEDDVPGIDAVTNRTPIYDITKIKGLKQVEIDPPVRYWHLKSGSFAVGYYDPAVHIFFRWGRIKLAREELLPDEPGLKRLVPFPRFDSEGKRYTPDKENEYIRTIDAPEHLRLRPAKWKKVTVVPKAEEMALRQLVETSDFKKLVRLPLLWQVQFYNPDRRKLVEALLDNVASMRPLQLENVGAQRIVSRSKREAEAPGAIRQDLRTHGGRCAWALEQTLRCKLPVLWADLDADTRAEVLRQTLLQTGVLALPDVSTKEAVQELTAAERLELASSLASSVHVLGELALDTDVNVRRAVARNPMTATSTLARLETDDADAEVRASAAKTVPMAPAEID